MYSSGSEFHLELPGGEIEGPKSLWQVPPYMTQPVIRASFQADMQSNHTAYIRYGMIYFPRHVVLVGSEYLKKKKMFLFSGSN